MKNTTRIVKRVPVCITSYWVEMYRPKTGGKNTKHRRVTHRLDSFSNLYSSLTFCDDHIVNVIPTLPFIVKETRKTN